MPRGWRYWPEEEDRRFYVYVLKHNGTPIWVGLGSGPRHEVRSHCARTAKPAAKREYILKHLNEITSEIVFADLPWEEGAEKESDLIEEYGLRCDGTGTLFNRTYGAGYGEQVADGVLAEIKAKKRAKREEQLRIAERIAEVRGVKVSTALVTMNQYRKAGGDTGYRLLLDPDYASKGRRGPSRALGKADEAEGQNV
jgi:hypothetical protein